MKQILDKHNLTENLLLYTEVRPTSIFVDNEITEGYVDNGRCDIVTKKLNESFIHEGKEIVGYTLFDKYGYGYENNTYKRFVITLYYAVNEVIK